MPTFDFSRVSYRQGREMTRAQIRLAHVVRQMDVLPPDADLEPLLAEYDALLDIQAGYVRQCIESVPPDWLIESAPDAIDWHDPCSLDYLRADKFAALIDAMAGAEKN